MASAVAITSTGSGLAVCYVRVEAEEAQDGTPSATLLALDKLNFSVDFEFLEDASPPPGAFGGRYKVLERMLSGSQLLTPEGRHRLVLQSQSYAAFRYGEFHTTSLPPWFAKAAEKKIEDHDILHQLLRQRLTDPDTTITYRAARSRLTAISNLGLAKQQSSTPAAAAAAAAAAVFGTPESARAYHQKKRGMRDVAESFLRSERCISPNASIVFSGFLAKIRESLADSLWLAMYDVQEQVKQQRQIKRSRGADPKGVYKANKRPRITETQQAVAAATPPAAAAAAGIVIIGVDAILSTPPQQRPTSTATPPAVTPIAAAINTTLNQVVSMQQL